MSVTITRLDIWYVTRRKPTRKKISVKPSGPQPVQMKLDVAKALKPIIKNVRYYYVVAVAEKKDGTEVYRTLSDGKGNGKIAVVETRRVIVPKTSIVN